MKSFDSSLKKKYQVSMLIKVLTYAVVLCVLGCIVWLAQLNLKRPSFEISNLPGAISNVSHSSVQSTQKSETQKQIPFDVCVVYSPGYLIDLGGLERAHPFDIKKYQKIHDQLLADGVLTEQQTFKPAELTREELLLVHTEGYLDDLKNRGKIAEYLEAPILKLAPVSLDKAVLRPFRHASGGTILAARLALETGIGVNIGGGYHHAKPDRGEGFCLFADVPIAIRKLQKENKIKRAVVIDVDVHQGNGTIICLDNDDTTFTFSMHQENIYPMPKEVGDLDVELRSGMGDDEYLEILNKHLGKVLDDSNADICFIVGGCDPLRGDPLASLEMTDEGIVKRDHAIVEACVKRKLPVVLTLSGGYREDAWRAQHASLKNLIETYKLSDLKPELSEESGKKIKSKQKSN